MSTVLIIVNFMDAQAHSLMLNIYLVKDKRKHHGAVDKCLSEQQFHKLDVITVVGAIYLVQLDLTAG